MKLLHTETCIDDQYVLGLFEHAGRLLFKGWHRSWERRWLEADGLNGLSRYRYHMTHVQSLALMWLFRGEHAEGIRLDRPYRGFHNGRAAWVDAGYGVRIGCATFRATAVRAFCRAIEKRWPRA